MFVVPYERLMLARRYHCIEMGYRFEMLEPTRDRGRTQAASILTTLDHLLLPAQYEPPGSRLTRRQKRKNIFRKQRMFQPATPDTSRLHVPRVDKLTNSHGRACYQTSKEPG